MGLLNKVFGNARKPKGKLGKMMARSMNGTSHAKMADWGLGFLEGIQADNICDIGCGGGRNVGELLKKYPGAAVKGVDDSPVSVETSLEYNREEIVAGRCEIRQGDVSAIDLPEASLDLATAFETVYFWPGLEKCFSQVARTLQPGGYFLIVNEADGESVSTDKWEKIVGGMKTYDRKELHAALTAAGFSDIQSWHHEKKPWIALLAKK